MNHSVLLLTLVNFFSYWWSVIGVFKKPHEQDLFKYRLLQINSVIIWAISIYCIYSNLITFHAEFILDAFLLGCSILFWHQSQIVKKNDFSLVFSKDAPKKLVKSGLYGRIRQPFYTIYLICYFSISIVYKSPLLFFFSTTMFLIYLDAAVFEERKFLNSDLKLEYLQYKCETHMFFPKLTKNAFKKKKSLPDMNQ
jgi:protein-S-isoprenylcysteine O-methyltransferase Ste14